MEMSEENELNGESEIDGCTSRIRVALYYK